MKSTDSSKYISSDEMDIDSDIKYEILENNKKDIKYVCHLADIHIRKKDRELEYRQVFDKLYEDIRKNKLNNNNSVIVICGDILHDKTELHPTSVALTRDFFLGLCEITDVICIWGNHDISLNNSTLNSLTSIVGKGLKTKNNLYLLPNDCLYEYNNLIFGLTTMFATTVTNCDISTDKIKIGLYHGTLEGSKNDLGFEFNSKTVNTNNKYFNTKNFNSYDYVFLGDIHKTQFLTKKGNIAYCGSLIQQHIDETMEKGYLLWNLDKGKAEFRRIKNDYGILKISIDEDGKSNLGKLDLPKYADIRIVSRSTNRKDIDNVYRSLEKNKVEVINKFDSIDHVTKNFDTKIEINGTKKNLSMLKNKEEIKKVILENLKSKEGVDKKTTIGVRNKIDKILSEIEINSSTGFKNIKLKSLSFDNVMIYGGSNSINFDKFVGIVGISDKNSSGKSSLIDIILHSIFGKCTRGSRADIVNSNKKSYKTIAELDVNSVIYKIERNGKRNENLKTTRNVSESLRFYENEKNISGDSIPNTNKLIEEKIGSYDDFLITSIVVQNLSLGFVDLPDREKKDMLCKMARLDVFDIIMNSSSKMSLSLAQELGKRNKLLNKYDEFGKDISSIDKNINEKISDTEKILIKYKSDLFELEKRKEEKTKVSILLECEYTSLKKKIDIDTDFDEIKYDELCEKIDKLSDYVNELAEKIKKNKLEDKKIKKNMKKLGNVENKLEKFNGENIKLINKKEILIDKLKLDLWNDNTINYTIYNKENINLEKQKIQSNIDDTKKEINVLEIEMKKLKIIIDTKINKVNNEDLKEFRIATNKLNENLDALKKNTININNFKIKINKIKDHEYDENCEYCMKNNITKEKIFLDCELAELVSSNKIINKENIKINNMLKKLGNLEEFYNIVVKFTEEKQNAEKDYEYNNKEKILLEKNSIQNNKDYDDINKKIIGYEKYLRNDILSKEIKILTDEIVILKNKKCKDYCKYLSYQEELKTCENENNKNELEHERKNNELLKNKIIKDVLNKNKDKLQENKEDIKKLKDNEHNLKIVGNDLLKLNIDIKKIALLIDKNNNELQDVKVKMNTFVDLKNDINKIQKDKDEYNLLSAMLNKNGIVDKILSENILPQLANKVNSLLQQFGSGDTMSIKLIGTNIFVYKNDSINAVMNGGYERHLLNLLFRVALAEINGYIRTNFMLFDEIFDSSDSDNKDNIKSLIQYLKSKFDWVLIVSHDSLIKDTFNKILTIQHIGKSEKKIFI
jgi:DNA repair exonuclease SbcCD ATPase subunit